MLNGSENEATRPIQDGQAEGCFPLHDPLMASFVTAVVCVVCVVCVVFMGPVCLKRSSGRKNGKGGGGSRPDAPFATVGPPVAPIGAGADPGFHFLQGTHAFHATLEGFKRFAVNERVMYKSDTYNGWVPAIVQAVNPNTGAIQLDVKPWFWLEPQVIAEKVRRGMPGTPRGSVS